MKLFIKRDQKAQTGLLGGHQGMLFQLSYRLELTPEEKALVDKYKVGTYPLTFKHREGGQYPNIRVEDLMRGGKEELKDISILLNNEQVIKEACASFKILLGVMATFGGEEVVDF